MVAIFDNKMFRQLEDSLVFSNICQKHNVQLIYTRQQHYNQGDPAASFLMKNMNSLINEYYSLTYSVRVKIVIFRNRIEVEYNISPTYAVKEDILR